MRPPILFAAACVWVISSAPILAENTDLLKSLRPEHPRLFATAEQFARTKQLVQSDPLARDWHEFLLKSAEKVLTEPTAEHTLVGPRMLAQSRAALRRISTTAGLYRLDGDKRFLDRARKEMLTAAAFPDWNPSHFLDVGEMTTALAIGYDWLFDSLSVEDRAKIRTAIVEKGLKASLPGYEKKVFWVTGNHNWVQVCNGGMTIGALAVAEDEPELSGKIIQLAREAIPRAMKSFAPDGGWPEGPGYWNYATMYNVLYLAALQSALGTDFDFIKMPGFTDTGYARIYSIGSIGKTFNYADAHNGAGQATQMFWMARQFNQPILDAFEKKQFGDKPTGNGDPIFALLWFNSKFDKPAESLPLDRVFRGTNVAYFRSAWDDPKAVFIGFKGGDNKANHSHLDLGSFVLDMFAKRWAIDLGSDDYNLPGYFRKERFSYYRLRTESHNTITIGNENQISDAVAPVIAYSSTPARAYAVADLTKAYEPKLTRAQRGIALIDRKKVLIQDELEAKDTVDCTWHFLTPAKVEISSDGRDAKLSQQSSAIRMRVIAPDNARIDFRSASAPPPQKQQPEVSDVYIKLPAVASAMRIAVWITPAEDAANAPEIQPLSQWIAGGKLQP